MTVRAERTVRHRVGRTLAGLGVAILGVTAKAEAQQLADTTFTPVLAHPAYAIGQGPRLCVDEGHFNFHTIDGRFAPFASLARRDGYRVGSSRGVFTAATLGACDLLVIANAQPSAQPWNRYPRPTPSAFTPEELAAVHAWVERGGALLVLADHMPLAGAAASLAEAFGARFTNGFAYDSAAGWLRHRDRIAARAQPTLFESVNGTLAEHPILRGRSPDETVTRVRSFTGQAFQWDASGAVPLLRLPADYVSLEPEIAWEFTAATPVRAVGGWLQGGARRVGHGRVVLLGEAAMFTAQRTGPQQRPMGMNAEGAEQNAQFVLNVLHWLSELIEPRVD